MGWVGSPKAEPQITRMTKTLALRDRWCEIKDLRFRCQIGESGTFSFVCHRQRQESGEDGGVWGGAGRGEKWVLDQ